MSPPLTLSPTSRPIRAVVGALLGTQAGRDVEIMTSFEVVAQPTDSGALELDHAYFVTRRDQCRSRSLFPVRAQTDHWEFFDAVKQVFPTFDVLGWYSVGDAPSAQDTALHKQVCPRPLAPRSFPSF